MSKPLKFLEKEESELIKTIGKETWENDKVYFVSEIVEFMNKYEKFLNNGKNRN